MVGLIRTAKDLEVYKIAFKISVVMHKLTLKFPKYEQFELGSQMRRASKSICANLSEGFTKQSSSDAEFKRYTLISAGSASEMIVWLDYCLELGYIDQTDHLYFSNEYEKIFAMLLKLKRFKK
jgi:four helix bundle protein